MDAFLLRARLFVCLFCAGSTLGGSVSGRAQCRPDQRRVTVADTIEMTEIAPAKQQPGTDSDAPGVFSPDGSRFAIVLRKGSVADDTNLYTLLVYSTQGASVHAKPLSILKMSSNSNRPAISDLRWLSDGRTVLFLGERPNAEAQIYSLDVVSQKLTRLTQHPTAVVAYDASADGRTIVFEAEPVPRDILHTAGVLRNGFVVTGEELSTLLLSGYRNADAMDFESRDLFVMTAGHRPTKVALEDGMWPNMTLSVSPNGRYALLEVFTRHPSPVWSRYREPVLHSYAIARKHPDSFSQVRTYLLLDIASAHATSLFNAPKDWPHDGYFWLDPGESLVVSHSYLPLEGVNPDEQRAREQHTSVIEISLTSRKVTLIDADALTARAWNQEKADIVLSGTGVDASKRREYHREGSTWQLLPSEQMAPQAPRPSLTVEEDLNTPPTLWLSDPSTRRKVMILDPNPQLRELCLGQEKEIEWNASDGHAVKGGLYLPPAYLPGQRYPLVIQTHAFEPHKFWIDGPWHSGYAAQPLAAKGIIVLQVANEHLGRSTPQEGEHAMAGYEGAIDFLDQQGMIDPSRVGIFGFSRTVYRVSYALTHSKRHFAAATFVDGVDGSYFQAVAFPSTEGPDAWALNGGPPWGADLEKWLERSPLFNLAHVSCPIRLEGHGVGAVLGLWPWYTLLSRKGEAVDMIVLPHAPHLLVKPWERLVSQQGNVDWFTFWLKNEEDPDPSKADEFARWRDLRKSAEKSNSATTEEK